MVKGLIILVADDFSNSELKEILTKIEKNHSEYKIVRVADVEELSEDKARTIAIHEDFIPEELKASIIYIGGVLEDIKQDTHIIREYYTNTNFRTALEVLCINQHLFGNPRVANMLKDFHISKAKLQQLLSVYTDIICHV